MGLLDVLMATRHGIGRLPSTIGGAPDYGTYDPYDPRNTPYVIEEFPQNRTRYGGGDIPIGNEQPVIRHGGTPPTFPMPRPVRPKTGWRDIVGDAIASGVAAGATPNIAGGGGSDMLRAAAVGMGVGEGRRQHRYDLARQAEQDAWDRMKEAQQMEDWRAQAELRRARANDITLPDGDWSSAGAGAIYHRRTGEIKKVPSIAAQGNVGAVPAAKPLDINRIIAEGGQSFPERRQEFTIPPPAGTPLVPDETTSVNVPPPQGYHAVPGTSGADQLILPDKGYKPPAPPKAPTNAWQILYEQDPEMAVALAKEKVKADNAKASRAPAGRAPRRTKTDQIRENTAAADMLGLKGDERTYFIANGRVPSKRTAGSIDDSGFNPFKPQASSVPGLSPKGQEYLKKLKTQLQ